MLDNVEVNPNGQRDPPSIILEDLLSHIPKLKRAGEVNKGKTIDSWAMLV